MRKILVIFIILVSVFGALAQKSNAQMMGQWNFNNQNVQQASLSAEDQQDIVTGQKLYQELQNKQVVCSKLSDNDFDKIGEYVMEQEIGNPSRHAFMNNMMKQMMGENGEKDMHIALGKRTTGCDTSAQLPQNGTGFMSMMGGGISMMGWGYANMMNGGLGWGFGLLYFLFWLVGFIDLILLGVWLWKQIKK